MDRVAVTRWIIGLSCAALLVLGASDARAAWAHLGNPVCVAPGAQHDPISCIPWIAWTDERDGVPQGYALELNDFTGVVSPVNGLRIAPSSTAQTDLTVIALNWDATMYAAWAEDRGLGTGTDVYLQHIVHGAPAPGWPVGGLRVASASGDQRHPRLLEGYRVVVNGLHVLPLVFVTWEDARAGSPALYATAIDSSSVTSPGWNPGGTLVSAAADTVVNVGLVRRGLGAVAVFEQAGSVLAQALSLDGVVPADPSFPVGGRRLSEAGVPASHAISAQDDRGGGGTAVVAWEEDRDGRTQIRAQGWRDSTSAMFFTAPMKLLDDPLARPSDLHVNTTSNTMTAVWTDERDDAGDLYRQDVSLPLTLGAADLLADPPGQPYVVAPGRQSNFSAKVGGFWEDARSGVPQIFAFFWPDGLPSGGPMAATGVSQTQPSASVSIGGFIPEDPPDPVVVWTDMRNPATGPDIYAQVLGPGGPGVVGVAPPGLPAGLALSNARPTPSRGGVSFALELPSPAQAEFVVTDVAGRTVRSLGRTYRPAGRNSIEWDGRAENGSRAAPGLYWVRGSIAGRPLAGRIVLLGD